MTKYSYLVMDINDLASTIKEAFVVARCPVLIDIPKDIQNMKIAFLLGNNQIKKKKN